MKPPAGAGAPRRRARLGLAALAWVAATMGWLALAPRAVSSTVAGAPPARSGTSGGGARAASPPAGTGPRVQLVGQTSWVTPGHPFVLDVAVAGGGARGGGGGAGGSGSAGGGGRGRLRLVLEVYPALASRSAFDDSLRNRLGPYPLQVLGPYPVAGLPTPDGQPGTVRLAVNLASAGRSPASHGPGVGTVDLGSCAGGYCAGVYPVEVALQGSGGTILDRFTTHLIYAPAGAGAKKLDLAWALPVASRPALTADGQPSLSRAQAAALSKLAGSLSGHADVALTLAPSPLTLAALGASGRPGDRATLAELATWAKASSGHQVLDRPFAPVSATALADAGLGGELSSQLARGQAVISAALHTRVTPATWLAQDHLDQAGLAALHALPGGPARHVVLPESDLAPLFQKLTPVQPFLLAGPGGHATEALAANQGLAAHLATDAQPVLAAHQLLADLATIYFDDPNAPYARGVALDATSAPLPSAAFLDVVLGALAHSPIVRAVTLDQLFTHVPLATLEGSDFVRQLVANPSPPPRLPVGALRADRRKLGAFASVLAGPRGAAVLTGMEQLLLVAESTDLSSSARSRYLSEVATALKVQLGRLVLPTETITLTARTGQIPVTIVSRAPYPVTGLLEVQSDKLGFPHPSQLVHLVPRHNNTRYFDVRVRASGEFPLRVSLLSPRGRLLLLSSQFAVRSSAISTVAVFLTVGAGAFLAIWWGRSLLADRHNRNRRLVPAGH